MKKHCSIMRSEKGFAFFSVFILLILSLTLGSASLVYSTLDLRSTTHYTTGNQALFSAEAGIIHALRSINSTGVIDFQNDIVARWDQVYGAATKTIPGYSQMGYQVLIAADPADPINRGSLVAIGSAPLQARRVLRVALNKSGFIGVPGAVYLAADTVSTEFVGTSFDVDGNNHDTAGNLTGGDAKPGIATRNETVTDGVVGSLTDGQKQKVRGQGFSLNPLTPSVLTTDGPSVNDLDQIVSDILSTPGVVTTGQKAFAGNNVFGTLAAPQVTYMTDADVILNGTATGAGVLIADGSITINGTLDFVGWIIVRGNTTINATSNPDDDTWTLGDATILGSLWTGHLAIKVGGNAIVDYCTSCMQLVDGIAPPTAHLVPRPMSVVSWQEIL